MKPTQQEIIELAELCDLGRTVGPLDTLLDHEWEDLLRLVHLALDRFGAGGGEPVAWMYFDSDGDAIFGHPNGYRPDDAVPVYTHPSPSDLRAEYLRGLEDAAKVADTNATDEPYGHAKFRCVNIAEAIRALKGKQ